MNRPLEGDEDESDTEDSEAENGSNRLTPSHDKKRRASRNALQERAQPPEPLKDDLVGRLLDIIKVFSSPVSDTYVLPSSEILDDSFKTFNNWDIFSQEVSESSGERSGTEVSKLLSDKADSIEAYARTIVEYLSFSNWSRALEYVRISLLQAAHPAVNGAVQPNLLVDDDRSALIVIRFISCFWVDSRKLSIVIQELCGSFLHLRKSFQTTVAIVIPQLITRWLERFPDEFIDLHSKHKRLDGGMKHNFFGLESISTPMGP